MGHEAIIYGYIDGANSYYAKTKELDRINADVISQISDQDDWPWVTRRIFSLPGEYPEGTYMSRVIHFGLSIKDDPLDDKWIAQWIEKFEAVLRRMFWHYATVRLESDFGDLCYEWNIPMTAIDGWHEDPPIPVTEWNRKDTGSRTT